MSRRATIDNINSKYRGSNLAAHNTTRVVGGVGGLGTVGTVGTVGAVGTIGTVGVVGARGSLVTGTAGLGTGVGVARTLRRSVVSPGVVVGAGHSVVHGGHT